MHIVNLFFIAISSCLMVDFLKHANFRYFLLNAALWAVNVNFLIDYLRS